MTADRQWGISSFDGWVTTPDQNTGIILALEGLTTSAFRLAKARNEVTITIRIAEPMTCPECNGSKVYVGLLETEPCGKFNGVGTVAE